MQQSRQVGIRELRTNLSSLLREVENGASILVTSHARVVAEIRPFQSREAKRRVPGALKGRIVMAPDFDDLPDDILDAMEGHR